MTDSNNITASLSDLNAALTLYVYTADTIRKARHPDKERKLLKQEAVKMLDSCIVALKESIDSIKASQLAEANSEQEVVNV